MEEFKDFIPEDPFDDGKSDLDTLMRTYQKIIKDKVQINELNIRDVTMELPLHRHYWTGRMFYHKNKIVELNKKRKKAFKTLLEHKKKEFPVGTSNKLLSDAVESDERMIENAEHILKHEMLVDYLVKIENNFRAMSYDVTNLVKTITLETT